MAATCCFGVAFFALNSFSITCVMRLPGMTPFAASAAISLMTACGSLLAILIPYLLQFLSDLVGLRAGLFLLGTLLLPVLMAAAFLPRKFEEASCCRQTLAKGELGL